MFALSRIILPHRFIYVQNYDDTIYREVFVRNISDEDQSSEKAKTDTNKVVVRKGENEKTKLPRRIFKSTSKDMPCSPLCKIPEEMTVNKKFSFVNRSLVC